MTDHDGAASAPGRLPERANPWRPITGAPAGRDLELAVLDDEGMHALVFPCRRQGRAWVSSENGAAVDIFPSHWREWRPG